MKFADQWARFRDWGLQMRPSWKSTQAIHEKHLLKFFGRLKVEEITTAKVQAYRLTRKSVGAATRNREVCSLTACLKWGGTPLRFVAMEPEVKKHRPYMSVEVLAQLTAELVKMGDTEAADVLTFAYYTGMRPKETLGLRWERVSIRGRSVLVVNTKNGRERELPLVGPAWEVIGSRWQRLAAVGSVCPVLAASVFSTPYYTVRRRIRLAADAVGVATLLYSARKSCGTNLRRAGVDWLEIKAFLGHRSDKAAQAYQEVDATDLRKAAEKLVPSGWAEDERRS